MSEKVNNSPQKHRGPMGRGPMGAVEKPKNFKGSTKKLLKYMGKYKGRVSLVIIFAICSTIFNIVGPKILGNATTILANGLMSSFTGSGEGIDFIGIGNIILWLVGLYIVSALFSYIQGFIMTDVSMKVTYNLRKDISKKLNKLPLKYFDGTTNGEVLSRITNDIDTLSQSLNQSLTQIITSVTSLIGIIIMMFSINFYMTLITLCIAPISLSLLSQ